jgi:hypothetical protein
MARMKKEDFEQLRTDFCSDLANKDENQALAELELVKNRVCDKVKAISQVTDAKKEAMEGFRDSLNVLKDELEEQMIYKMELENHIRKLNAN